MTSMSVIYSVGIFGDTGDFTLILFSAHQRPLQRGEFSRESVTFGNVFFHPLSLVWQRCAQTACVGGGINLAPCTRETGPWSSRRRLWYDPTASSWRAQLLHRPLLCRLTMASPAPCTACPPSPKACSPPPRAPSPLQTTRPTSMDPHPWAWPCSPMCPSPLSTSTQLSPAGRLKQSVPTTPAPLSLWPDTPTQTCTPQPHRSHPACRRWCWSCCAAIQTSWWCRIRLLLTCSRSRAVGAGWTSPPPSA